MTRKNHPNAKRWLTPPTIEQIDAVIKKLGVSEPHFESYYGLYNGCIAHARMGFRDMPLKHWHLFLGDLPARANINTNKLAPIRSISPSRAKSSTALNKLVS